MNSLSCRRTPVDSPQNQYINTTSIVQLLVPPPPPFPRPYLHFHPKSAFRPIPHTPVPNILIHFEQLAVFSVTRRTRGPLMSLRLPRLRRLLCGQGGCAAVHSLCNCPPLPRQHFEQDVSKVGGVGVGLGHKSRAPAHPRHRPQRTRYQRPLSPPSWSHTAHDANEART